MDAGLLIAMGLAGSLHCAGMCGGLSVLVTGAGPRLRNFLAYAAGKTVTYVFLGALAGASGQAILKAAPLGSRFLALAAAVLLLFAAAESAGVVRYGGAGLGWLRGLAGGISRFAAESGAAGRILLGAANGLLPCPLVYGFVALAAATGSPLGGAFTMSVLGVTSAIPLAVCAAGGTSIRHRLGAYSRYAVAALMLTMAVLLVQRGLSTPGVGCHAH
jgi:uncharacterized protein